MRCGDVYRLNKMVASGDSNAAILKHFKWHYPEDEIRKFLPKAKLVKPEVEAEPEAKVEVEPEVEAAPEIIVKKKRVRKRA